MTAADTDAVKGIREALTTGTGGGSFTQTVELVIGDTRNHRFSFAAGMASSFWEWKYREAFHRSAPDWVSLEHPFVRSQLFQIAIRANSALPDIKPNDRCCEPDPERERG